MSINRMRKAYYFFSGVLFLLRMEDFKKSPEWTKWRIVLDCNRGEQKWQVYAVLFLKR